MRVKRTVATVAALAAASGLDRDAFHRDVDRTIRRTGVAFGAWFVFCALVSLAVLGVGAWAVIRLVLHFT
jgi:hypothetical protein